MKREAKNFPEAAQDAVMFEATDAEYLTVKRIAMATYCDDSIENFGGSRRVITPWARDEKLIGVI